MDFEDYISLKAPNFEEFLNEAQIVELRGYYDKWVKFLNSATACLNGQFTSAVGVDYVNDYEKNMAEAARNKNLLDTKLEQYKKPVEQVSISSNEFRI